MTVNADVDAAATAAPPASDSPDQDNPALLGVPTFVIGSIALGLYLIGYRNADHAIAGALPILILCNGVGLLIATRWAARRGEGPVATIFGIFAGFWLSFSLLALGLAHGWFGTLNAAGQVDAQATFLLTWLIGIVILTVTTLRLPVTFTLLFVLVDFALVVVLLGTINGSTTLLKVGGVAVFAFGAVGVYIFGGAMNGATGGSAFPLGRPLIGR